MSRNRKRIKSELEIEKKTKERNEKWIKICEQTDPSLYNKDFILLVLLDELCEIPVWRRIRVYGGISLSDFQLILNAAMGWGNGHLYKFIAPVDEYAPVFIGRERDLLDETFDYGTFFYSENVKLAMIAGKPIGHRTPPKKNV